MKYSTLYKKWKNKQRSYGYKSPSETTEAEFKRWIDDQIAGMWNW